MYEAFYGLKTKPFSILPDPEFIYWASPHSMAYTMLEYGVMNHAGFTVITGEVGSGKTTLLRQLLSKLPQDITVGLVSNTQGDRDDLLQWLMMSLDQEFEGLSYVSLYKQFQDFLRRAARRRAAHDPGHRRGAEPRRQGAGRTAHDVQHQRESARSSCRSSWSASRS